jgi:hypothetical protein
MVKHVIALAALDSLDINEGGLGGRKAGKILRIRSPTHDHDKR